MPEDKVLDILFQYVMSELFPKKANEVDSVGSDLNDVLQIHGTSVHSNKSSARSTKFNCFEETISLENKFPNSKSRTMEGRTQDIQKYGCNISSKKLYIFIIKYIFTPLFVCRKYDNFKDNGIIKSERDAISVIEDKLFRPHTGRNKLGTVFNEKVVVSPVPYILSTRESFSTVKTTPIKYMGQTLDVSTFQGMSDFYYILRI